MLREEWIEISAYSCNCGTSSAPDTRYPWLNAVTRNEPEAHGWVDPTCPRVWILVREPELSTCPDGQALASIAPLAVDYLFLIGTGRCGSTLLARILASHPDVAFISAADERLRRMGSRGRLNGIIYRGVRHAPRRRTGWLRMRYQPSEGWSIFSDEVSEMIATPCRDLTEHDASPWLSARLKRTLDSRAAVQGRPVFLHKFTGWPRARLLHEVFPQARFVHVVRDGRAVANSALQMDWWPGYRGPTEWMFGPISAEHEAEWVASERSFAVLAGLEWKLLMDAYTIAHAAIPPAQWMTLRYEDLVADPETVVSSVAEFARLDASRWAVDEVISSFKISDSRRDSFQSELSRRDNELLNRSLAGHLAHYGYVER